MAVGQGGGKASGRLMAFDWNGAIAVASVVPALVGSSKGGIARVSGAAAFFVATASAVMARLWSSAHSRSLIRLSGIAARRDRHFGCRLDLPVASSG